MKWVFISSISFLMLGFSNFNSIKSTATQYGQNVLDTNPSRNNDTLIFAHVIVRHGDRNICKQYPLDENKDEKFWIGGLGALTNKGKRQLFNLGEFLRRRYHMILGDKYSPNKVYILSTDYDRTLMSAQAMLAGLFYPSEEEKWNKDIPWQPIPVHTAPKKFDYILAATRDCPKFNFLEEMFISESAGIKSIFTEHSNLFDLWSTNFGANFTTPIECYRLYDTLTIEKNLGMRIPEWAENAIAPNGPLEIMAKLDLITSTGTRQMARLKQGFLIKEIFQHFFEKIESTLEPDRTLWIYSAHDYVIASVLNIFGLYKLDGIAPAASLHFELYKNNESAYYVQIFLRKYEEEYPIAMNIPGCGEKCPLNQLYKLIEDIIPGDFDTECEV